jgi:hypothetical protein
LPVTRTIALALLVALVPAAALSQRASSPAPPRAIVTEVRGLAQAESPGAAIRKVRTLDWFTDGTRLSTGAAGSMVVVFQNGVRTRLGERSQVLVAADGPAEAKGIVETLPPVPPLPQVEAVPLEGPATRINAVRVRGEAFARLLPDGAAVLADGARLEFVPEQEFSSYAISIERTDGSIAFEKTTTATSIDVPPGVLTPGAQYHWHVQAQDPLGHRVRASARFETLTSEQSARRQALRQHLGTNPDHAAFLAEIDRSLGLSR